MTNIYATKLSRGKDLVLHFVTFLGLIYDDLDRHRFYDEYIFVTTFMSFFRITSQKIR